MDGGVEEKVSIVQRADALMEHAGQMGVMLGQT